MDKIKVFKGEGRHPWYWRVVAANGQTLLTSEGYSRKAGAFRSARNFCKRNEEKPLDYWGIEEVK